MKFEYIQGKKNVIADVIPRLRTFGLYQDNNSEVQLSLEDAIENIIEKIHSIESTQKIPGYTKIVKLNLNLLRKEQLCNRCCKKKVKKIKMKPDPSFILDENSILRQAFKLRYSVEPIIVAPRKLTNIIILEFHDGKGHQGISWTVNMMQRYFWWIGMMRDTHQYINTCKLCIQFLPNSRCI